MAFKWFKKESGIVDFTDRGKNIPEIKTNYKVTKDGFIELKDKQISQTPGTNSSSNSNLSSGFDFLNDMAVGSSTNSSSSSSSLSNLGSGSNSIEDSGEISKNLRHMSTRIEDNSNELYRLLHRIELLERKIERLEGRS